MAPTRLNRLRSTLPRTSREMWFISSMERQTSLLSRRSGKVSVDVTASAEMKGSSRSVEADRSAADLAIYTGRKSPKGFWRVFFRPFSVMLSPVVLWASLIVSFAPSLGAEGRPSVPTH